MTKINPPKSRRVFVALTVAAAVLATGLLVALSQLGGGNGGNAEEIYAGIPQSGTTIGEADAPVTISVYEDFQCPFCGRFSRETLPKIVQEYVRTGKVKVESKTMAFLGEDSLTAARPALAAGEQDLYWQYHSLLFENQGSENSGYVTEKFVDGLARQVSGLDLGAWQDARAGGSFGSEMEKVQEEAQASGISSTPTLILSGPRGEKKLKGAKDFEEVSAAITKVSGS